MDVKRYVGVTCGMSERDIWDRSVYDLGGCWTLHFGLEGDVWHLILHFKLIILYDSTNSARIKYSSVIQD